MALTEILLIQPVESLGMEGDQVSVRAGFARNYLIPRQLAVAVNRANVRRIAALKVRRQVRETQDMEAAEAVAAKLKSVQIVFAVKTGEAGKMFGAITTQDLIQRFEQEGVTLDKKRVSLLHPVKTLGQHSVKIKLHADLSLDLDFEVVSENPIED